LFRNPEGALLAGFLKGPVQESLRLAEQRVLVRMALQPGDKVLHHAATKV
jgi:hypothetical protein